MIIKDELVTYTWSLHTLTEGTYPEIYFDLQLTTPSGIVSFYNGEEWATAFSTPTVGTDGYIQFEYTHLEEGVYTLIVSYGNSSYIRILHTTQTLVVVKDDNINKAIILPGAG